MVEHPKEKRLWMSVSKAIHIMDAAEKYGKDSEEYRLAWEEDDNAD